MDNAGKQTAIPADAGEKELTVTQLERCAVHDGPGIRTVVFLQGCPLHCGWCCNPETQLLAPAVMRDAGLCVGCGACAAHCPSGAARMVDGAPRFDRESCRLCGACVQNCPVGALHVSGRTMTVSEILERVHRDDAFYAATGGGLTLSGGEPLLRQNAVTLLQAAKTDGLSTVVETTANVPEERLLAAAPYTDRFLIDYKHPDAAKLLEATGAWLPLIERNVRALLAINADVTLRTPVIPDFNDDAETLRRCFAVALGAGVRAYVLLPFHALGRKKYDMLAQPYEYAEARVLCAADLEPLRALGEQMGLSVTIGG